MNNYTRKSQLLFWKSKDQMTSSRHFVLLSFRARSGTRPVSDTTRRPWGHVTISPGAAFLDSYQSAGNSWLRCSAFFCISLPSFPLDSTSFSSIFFFLSFSLVLFYFTTLSCVIFDYAFAPRTHCSTNSKNEKWVPVITSLSHTMSLLPFPPPSHLLNTTVRHAQSKLRTFGNYPPPSPTPPLVFNLCSFFALLTSFCSYKSIL